MIIIKYYIFLSFLFFIFLNISYFLSFGFDKYIYLQKYEYIINIKKNKKNYI